MDSVRDVRADRGSVSGTSEGDTSGGGRSAKSRSYVAVACAVTFVCSALLLYFGFGFHAIPGLSWLVPLPALLLAPRVPTWAALTTTGLSYVASTVPAWGFYAQSVDTPLWPIGVMIMSGFLVTLTLSVWIFRRLIVRGRALLATLTAPAVWTGLLFVMSISNPMGMMGTFATMQAGVPPVAKLAAVTGWPGLDYLVFFVAAAVAALLAPGIVKAARIQTAVATSCVLVLALGIAPLIAGGKTGPTRTVAALASNESTWGVRMSEPDGRRLLDQYVQAIAALPQGTDTVVLPEGAFTVDDRSLVTLNDRLGRVARANDVTIVVGYNRVSGDKKYDSARVIPADGEQPVTYLKHHDRVSQLGNSLVYQPGTGGRVGVQICLDINLQETSHDYALDGARAMLVPGADNGENGWQHSREAMLRGVENGFSVAWADMNGHSAIAGSDGAVRDEASSYLPAAEHRPITTAVGDIDDGPGATPYTRYGDWFAWLVVALAVVGSALSWVSRARSRLSSRDAAMAAR
ncbi:apolipoprotein N-acyltransferase [Prauserella sp. Am3]|nr:apolipoprotein N-acyltransferase [Prauserella sp. Am3]